MIKNYNDTRVSWKALALLTSACVAMPVMAQAQNSLEEVVVTARRAEESMQTTPIAVTAISADAIRKSQIQNAVDIQRSAPSLNISTGGPGASGMVLVAIRGQGALRAVTSADPAVATYLDGVYIPRPSQGITEFNDLQRIEVLRGPQGTLFGRNTIGGALNIITNDPVQDVLGSVRAEVGNHNYRGGGFLMNLPVNDKLAMRVVFNARERDGYAPNTAAGRDFGSSKSIFGRIKLKYVEENWDLTLSADYNKIEDNGVTSNLQAFNPALFGPGGSFATFLSAAQLSPFLFNPDNFYATYGTGYQTPPNNTNFAGLSGADKALYSLPLSNELTAKGVQAVLNVDLGFARLKSISAYRESNPIGVVDSDGTPFPLLTTNSQAYSEQISQELQLSGDLTDKLSYITGFFISKETGFDKTLSQSLAFLPQAPTAPYRGLLSQNFSDVVNKTTGVFGQGYYQITPTIRFAGGLRWTWDTRETVLHNLAGVGVGVVACNITRPDAPGVCDQTQVAKFDYPAWTAGLDWQATDDIFLYAVTRGAAKSGGWNTGAGALPAFAPEKNKDVELGAKTAWLENRLRINVALFNTWQTGVHRTIGALVNNLPANYVINAGDARVWGAEFEVSATPWTGGRIDASASLMDGKYKKGTYSEIQTVPGQNLAGCVNATATTAFCTVDRTGEELPQLPKTQFGIGFTQDIPVSIGNVSLHADYSYRGAMVFAPITPAAQLSAAAQVPYLRENELARIKGYGLVGARAGIELDNGLEVSLFARNLLNKKYITRTYSELYRSLGISINYLGEPRMYGVSMTYKFN